MRNYQFVLLITSLLSFSCGDQSQEKQVPRPPKSDSVVSEKVDTILSNETFAFFENSGFTTFAKERAAGFDWNKFKLVEVWTEDSALISSFTPSPEFLQNYGPYLKYARDSSMALDLDSYNINIVTDKNGGKRGQEMGPDTEVSLIDFENKEKQRLVFVGPSGSVEDGGWLDEETIVLVGLQENQEPGTKSAVVWKYHVPTQTYFLYEMQDPLNAEKLMNEWRKKRLKDVKIK